MSEILSVHWKGYLTLDVYPIYIFDLCNSLNKFWCVVPQNDCNHSN